MVERLTSPAREYRPEIDGLRAVAVLSVLFYHFGVPGFSGGFTGVDIFFVISGFLIGGILWSELERTGGLRLRDFYLRRVRRLAPAYFTMAGVTLVLAWQILLPFEFREFGKELIASTVYLSNVHFWREAGYFDTLADSKVLLHTWSLSVEEQFYIALPLLLLLFARWRGALVWILALVCAASLAACIWMTARAPEAAFFLFPFRAWELLSGVLLAVLGQRRRAEWSGGPAMSWLGLALVLYGIVAIGPSDAFPGVAAVLPVLGALLILMNGRDANAVNRALASRWPVRIGLISYSLYLWHWPVYTLSTYWRGGDGAPVEVLFWMAVSVALGWLSWRFVETPLRIPRGALVAPLVGGTVLASAVLLAFGGLIYLRDGMAGRFPQAVRTHIEASADFNQDWSRCHVPESGPLAGIESCPIGPGGEPRVLIWGDSHVRAFKEGLEQAAFDAGTPAVIVWNAGCPPLYEVFKVESAATKAEDRACTRAQARMRAALERGDAFDTILLIGRWSYYRSGSGTGLDARNRIELFPLPDGSLAEMPQDELFDQAMALTTLALGTQVDRVFVLRQMPEIPRYDSRVIARALAHGRLTADEAQARAHVSRFELRDRAGALDDALIRLHEDGRITLLDTWPGLCDDTGCSALQGGEALYFDNNHITNRAAQRLSGVFAPVFAGQTVRAARDE